MPSPAHATLKTRIEELAGRFVDFDIPLDRAPTAHELDMIASFKLLAHAEFETFIETRVRETIQGSLAIWKGQKRATRALFTLLLRWYPHFEPEKNPYFQSLPFAEITSGIEKICRKAEIEVGESNGIKRETCTRLCYSAGLLLDEISPLFLAAVESYGKHRGDVAHNAVGKVQTLNDPRVEAQYARQIVTFLDQLDQDLSKAAA